MDTSDSTAFSRLLLAQIRKELTPEQRERLRGAWSYMYDDRRHGEFHVKPSEQEPDGFYWYGAASDAYEARYNGISAWLQKNWPEDDAESSGVTRAGDP